MMPEFANVLYFNLDLSLPMQIAEKFYSIQGEGKLAGVPSLFIRVSGCNLRCQWCDTPYASWRPEGREMTVADLAAWVESLNCHYVVITGGEPAIMPEIGDLCAKLSSMGRHITLETAGTVFKSLPIDLVSLSPKLSNSTPQGPAAARHEALRLDIATLQAFIDSVPDIQIKFVIQTPADLDEAKGLLGRLVRWRGEDIMLMPEGTTAEVLEKRSQWLIEACKREGFRFCPRLHVMVWGAQRGV